MTMVKRLIADASRQLQQKLFDLTGLKHGHEHHSGFEAKND
jgi:hypothetical protein